MTITEFAGFAEGKLKEVMEIFKQKNKSYGQDNNAFFNFRSSALRVFGDCTYESMFKVLITYMDKHLVALANKGIHEPEYESRLKDVIVYCLLAIGLEAEYQEEKAMENL